MHPIYKKVVRTTKKIMAHDESNEIEIGALVRVVESKPLSRHKRWVVEEILKAEGAPVLVALADEAGLIEGADADVEAVEAEGDETDDTE
jgi:small subunit ribosomal protein S17